MHFPTLPPIIAFFVWIFFPISLFVLMSFPWYRFLKYPKKSLKIGTLFLLLILFLIPFAVIISWPRMNVAIKNIVVISFPLEFLCTLFSLGTVLIIRRIQK